MWGELTTRAASTKVWIPRLISMFLLTLLLGKSLHHPECCHRAAIGRNSTRTSRILTSRNRFIQRKGWLDAENGRLFMEFFDRAGTAADRVTEGRRLTQLRDIGNEIRKQYDPEVWDKQPKDTKRKVLKTAPMVDEGLVKERIKIPNGATAGWISCNVWAAKYLIEEAGKGPVDVEKDFITPYNDREPSHRNNIWAAKGAVTKSSGGLVQD